MTTFKNSTNWRCYTSKS
jgi:hypothetical protein